MNKHPSKSNHYVLCLLILTGLIFLCSCKSGEELVDDINTPTPSPTATSTPTLSPTPTLTPLERCLISNISGGSGTGCYITAASYLNALYSYDMTALSNFLSPDDLPTIEQLKSTIPEVREISDIDVYFKTGIDEATYIVYSFFNLTYNNSRNKIPAMAEFGVSHPGAEDARIYPVSSSEELYEASVLSRSNPDIRNMFIEYTIKKYLASILANSEECFSETVTDYSSDLFEFMILATEYIESYEDVSVTVFDFPKNPDGIDYLVLSRNKTKFINIDTLAPGAEEYLIHIDENSIPYIFIGETSKETEVQRELIRKSSEYISITNDVTAELTSSMEDDPELKDFVLKLNGN